MAVAARPVDAHHISAAHPLPVHLAAEVVNHHRSGGVVDELHRRDRVFQNRDVVDVGLLEILLPGLEALVRPSLLVGDPVGVKEGSEAVVQPVEPGAEFLPAIPLWLKGSFQRVGLAGVRRPRVERHVDAGGGERGAGRLLPRAGLDGVALAVLDVGQHAAAVPALVQVAQVFPDAHQLGEPAVDGGLLVIAGLQIIPGKAAHGGPQRRTNL